MGELAGADCSRRLAELRHRDPHEHAEKKCRYKIADEYNRKSGKITLLVALNYISDPAGVERVALEADAEQSHRKQHRADISVLTREKYTAADGNQHTRAYRTQKVFQHISIFSADETISPMI